MGSLLSNGVIPDDLVEAARDEARRSLKDSENTGTWSNELVWALAAEVLVARESRQ